MADEMRGQWLVGDGLPPSVPELLPPPVAPQNPAAGTEVWVAETWSAHGEDNATLGVYVTREAAFAALKAMENMTVYVDEDGNVRARPRVEKPSALQYVPCNHPAGPQFCPCGGRGHHLYPPLPRLPVKWGRAYPVKVQG